MKRILPLAFAFALVLALPLAACSSSRDSADSVTGEDGVEAASASESQTVVFPSAYFDDCDDADACIALLEGLGCTQVSGNGDGTYTASMSAEVYNSISEDALAEVMDAIEILETDEDTYPHVDSVEYANDFGTITIYLNTDQAGLEDTYAPALVGIPAAVYQQLAGFEADCHVELVASDGTVLDEKDYPFVA